MRNVDCQVGYGYLVGSGSEEYRGLVSHTNGGLECQSWVLDKPHPHDFNHVKWNYCRNPGNKNTPEEEGVWCYTEDPNKRWDLCPVRRCSECDTGKSAAERISLNHFIRVRLQTSGLPGGHWVQIQRRREQDNGWARMPGMA